MRLPLTLRIKASRDFARVKKEGTTFSGRYVVLSVLRDDSVRPFRFGIITSRKLGGAVTRVRLRRQFREIVRALQVDLLPGWFIVIIPRWKAVGAPLADMAKDWRKVAQRAGIIPARSSDAGTEPTPTVAPEPA
jgi:ribonuclease P protein component